MSSTATERFAVEELWVDSLGVSSVNADWSEGWTETWEAYACPDCPECGEYARYDTDAYGYVCRNSECERNGESFEPDEPASPMMNYHYPLPDLNRFQESYDAPVDVHEVEWRIRDLPLCLVYWIEQDAYSLALTGGGMDLSWEICEAFTRLGYLPPLHFADLPAMAGMPRDDSDEYVIDACIRSAEVAEHQAARTRETLTERYRGEARVCDTCGYSGPCNTCPECVKPTRPLVEEEEADDTTYEIVRFRREGENEVLETGLSLEEAQEHCNRADTSGEGWFDGYRAE